MKDINKIQVRYLYRHEWKEMYVILLYKFRMLRRE